MLAAGSIGGVLVFGWPILESVGSVIWGTQNENLLTAIPLFILLGEVLLRSGLADRMYAALALWFDRLPGGLLHTNIACCALFAATSGSSVATAATVGTVALPALEERGYPRRQTLGSLAAGGTLGILIPPSVNLLVYGSLTNTSVGQLFIAGIVPGVLLTLLFMAWIAFANRGITYSMPVRPSLEVKLRSLLSLLPPLTIFFVVMGSIYFGIATPTESAGLGVVAALIFAGTERRLTRDFFRACFWNTARTTGMVLLIITAAFVLNVTLALLGVAQAMSTWIGAMGLSPVVLLLALMAFYLALGMFMDVLSMQVLTIPITVPLVMAVGIDPIWFGIFIVLMCELGLITPPVGMNLYVVQGVRQDHGPFYDVVLGALPYAGLMIAFTFLLMAWPDLALWLPRTMMGTP
jgi:tripartite ATP-independent transporter DctM subunit